jgi:molybdopterin synthase sulfur carrier subunit
VKVRIRYFGRFAVEIGKFSEEIEMPEDAKVGDLLNILKEKYPFLHNEVIEISINGKYVEEDSPITGEISIFPPISGG